MVSRSVILPLIIVVILSGIGGILTAQKVTQNKLEKTRQSAVQDLGDETAPGATDPLQKNSSEETNAKPGRYTQYSKDDTSNGYENTILFFYASWCPECRGFKQNLKDANIPENTQILEVNYDKSDELKKQYSVTLQSTFVNISSSGAEKSKWVGYGKDKSLETVLENLKVQ